MSEGRQYVTHFNMQRDLEASEARHLDLARRYDVLAARLAEVEAERDDWKGQRDDALDAYGELSIERDRLAQELKE